MVDTVDRFGVVGSRRNARRALLIGLGAYLALGLTLFWHVLALSPTRGATCTCSDVAQFTWFLEWPFAALRHGLNPLHTTAIFHPHGLNVLANTSSTGLGVLLLPVTAIFGPLAALNVGLIAAPVLSATALMFVAQRWTRSALAAFIAGALYGFSPLILFHDALGHLNVTFLVVPPLVVACVDELFWRRRLRPERVGLALGLLLAWQFFLGSEILVMILVAGALSLLGLGAFALVTERERARRPLREGTRGLLVAAGTAATLLIAPVLYAMLGPGHYSGPVWPGTTLSNDSLRSFVTARGGPGLWFAPSTWHFLPSNYLSPALLGVLVIGTLWRWRDRRLGASVALLALMAWLTLGRHYWFGAWHWLVKLPLLVNVVNDRFSVFLFLFGALALARILDELSSRLSARAALASVVLVSSLVVAPYVIDAVHVAPYRATSVWVPRWYQVHGGTLANGQVVLGFPFYNTSANLLAVQALNEMRYSVVGGTTPQWLIERQGVERPGYQDLWDLSSTAAAPVWAPSATATQANDVRNALASWGVTYVVVPVTNGPNTSSAARRPQVVMTWLSSVLGSPSRVDGAWVWHHTHPSAWRQ